jgi:Ca2+-dependent lipid-binding protein
MKKENYSEMSKEELQKNLKTFNLVTGVLAGMLITLFIVSILTFKQLGFSMVVVPIALSSIVFINYGTIKKIQKELKSRE